MNKYQTAEYLANLHTLLTAQESAGGTEKSRTLSAEYDKHWGILKDQINKENEHETR